MRNQQRTIPSLCVAHSFAVEHTRGDFVPQRRLSSFDRSPFNLFHSSENTNCFNHHPSHKYEINYLNTTMICSMPYNNPATQALQGLDDRLPAPEIMKRRRRRNVEAPVQSASNKRRRTCLDMSDVLSMIKPVEDSITFPSIEWLYDDEDVPAPERCTQSCLALRTTEVPKLPRRTSSSCLLKRSRGGLVRSRSKTACLVSLVGASSQNLKADCLSAMNSSTIFTLSSGDLKSSRDSVAFALATLTAD